MLLDNFHSDISCTHDVDALWDRADVYAVTLGDHERATCGITDANRSTIFESTDHK